MRALETKAKFNLISAMFIFGTIGIFRRFLPYSSSIVAFFRGIIGVLFLAAVILCRRQKLNIEAIKKNLALLCISGACLGINWILIFEAYRYTTVATATLCYNMTPVLVIIASPFILKEKLTLKKAICALVAIIGIVVISGIFTDGGANLRGVLFGLSAAVFYASLVILNKFIKGVSDFEKTIIQLGMAAIAILPYMLLTEDMGAISFELSSVALLLFVGILHTGVAYTLYFGSIGRISAQSAAICSYIDPVVALVLSALILKEDFGLMQLAGSVLILGAALVSELPSLKRKKTDNIEKNS